MANKRISELNENTSPSGDNILPIVASGDTIDDLTAGEFTVWIWYYISE